MNKLTKGLLTLSLSAAILGSVACGGNESDAWKGTTFTDYGTVTAEQVHGGFIEETDKYVYFINGMGSSSSDNTFGTPIKGALVAADKNDLSKTKVVIPELIVSSDYNAGVYLFKEEGGVYAYYGTPNREKNSSGETAYSEMTFTKTRLDGKENTKLFTVSSHSVNYRIAQAENGEVYIVYYDSENSALVAYNCNTKAATTLAKTDSETNEKVDGEYLSLADYKFLDNGNKAQVVYTMTVYSNEYYSEQEEAENSYSRKTASHNYMYLYTAGSATVKVKSAENTTYTIKSVIDDYIFYTEKTLGKTEKTFGAKISEISSATEINYADNIKDGMIIKSLTEVYYLDESKVVKNTLIKTDSINEYNTKIVLLNDESLSSLIDIDDNYIYCFNSDGYIVAVERAGEGRTIRISERTASLSWYAPETVTIGGEKYMLYCDNSSVGNSYIYYADLSKLADPIAEDTDDDEENDLFYIESAFIGKMPAEDRAASAVAVINDIEKPLDADTSDNGVTFTADNVTAARKAYDALDDDAKKYVSEEDYAKLTNAEKALQLWAAFNKLETVLDFDTLSDTDKDALTTNYNTAKTLAESFGDDLQTIRDYLTDNLNYFYQQTATKLTSTEG